MARLADRIRRAERELAKGGGGSGPDDPIPGLADFYSDRRDETLTLPMTLIWPHLAISATPGIVGAGA